MDEKLKEQNYVEELIEIIRSTKSNEELRDKLSDYHENDIADAFVRLDEEERKRLYPILGAEQVAEIFTYIDDPDLYLNELDLDKAARVISYMDSDDAVDVLDELDDSKQAQLVELLDEESSHDIKMIQSYEDDEVGSKMTTNFIVIKNDLTIRQAMRELIRQAGENDNILTVYVTDEAGKFYGAIDLKDLIIARENNALEDIISTSYPYLRDHEQISECIERMKDYAEDSIPVLDENDEILGVITSQDIVEVVDRLSGLTSISKEYIKILLKITGITFISEISSDISKDCGYTAVANQIQIFGKLTVLVISLPVFVELISAVSNLLT